MDCHGGLIYSKNHLFGQDDEDTWWIGFDCGLFSDGIDKDTFNKLYEEELLSMSPFELRTYMMNFDCVWKFVCGCPVRTQEYVESECRKIIDQILRNE